MADLSKLNFKKAGSKTATLKLEDPISGGILKNEDGTEWSIDLLSLDSDEFRKAQRAIADQQIQKATATGRIRLDVDQIDNSLVETLVACTKGWQGLEENGAKIVFSAAEARRVYIEHPWLREQVNQFVTTRANFRGNL